MTRRWLRFLVRPTATGAFICLLACPFAAGAPSSPGTAPFPPDAPREAGAHTSRTPAPPAAPGHERLGDTLTVIQRPLLNIPAFIRPGERFAISCEAPEGTAGWAAELIRGERRVPLTVIDALYEPSTLWWFLTVEAPAEVLSELYDLEVTADGGIHDVAKHAVKILEAYKSDYCFIHVTDPHLPTHIFSPDPGAATDSAATLDLRAVIDDVNIINPEFVLLTGDLLNEGELEDYLLYRDYSKAQRVLSEFQVPVFLTAGNHDLGGWESTPPSDGTARRNWWRFFGWRRLADPPSGAPARTQDYSFDYGPIHFTGLEGYINYDGWRSEHYGGQSFTSAQLQWLEEDLSGTTSAAQVLFYHDDFGGQLDLAGLGAEMGLWGHIHRDAGSLSARPYDLATEATVDGKRAYRIVRVSGATLTPLATVHAGSNGEVLRAVFSPANDGSHDSLTAVVVNGHSIRFPDARIRFRMRKPMGYPDVRVNGGTLLQLESAGPVLTCSVGVDLLPSSTQTVTVVAGAAGPPPGPPRDLRLAQNSPNPFKRRTSIGFDLPLAGPVRLDIFSPDGRRVVTLLDEVLPASSQTEEWDGLGEGGRPAASGIYFYRLTTLAGTLTRRLSLVR